MIPSNISKKVLTVGEEYRDFRGGIAAVISNYSQHFENFKFICTYNQKLHKSLIIPFFFSGLMSVIFKLLVDKEIKVVHLHGAAKGSFLRKFSIFLIFFRKQPTIC
jgi:fucose 4-O-acetylase-like acetyltransferase